MSQAWLVQIGSCIVYAGFGHDSMQLRHFIPPFLSGGKVCYEVLRAFPSYLTGGSQTPMDPHAAYPDSFRRAPNTSVADSTLSRIWLRIVVAFTPPWQSATSQGIPLDRKIKRSSLDQREVGISCTK